MDQIYKYSIPSPTTPILKTHFGEKGVNELLFSIFLPTTVLKKHELDFLKLYEENSKAISKAFGVKLSDVNFPTLKNI